MTDEDEEERGGDAASGDGDDVAVVVIASSCPKNLRSFRLARAAAGAEFDEEEE